MIDTRTCCAGNIPEEIKNLQRENYHTKQLNKFLVVVVAAAILLMATIKISERHISKEKQIN